MKQPAFYSNTRIGTATGGVVFELFQTERLGLLRGRRSRLHRSERPEPHVGMRNVATGEAVYMRESDVVHLLKTQRFVMFSAIGGSETWHRLSAPRRS